MRTDLALAACAALGELRRFLHQIERNETDGDERRENRDRKRPVDMPPRMTPEGQECSDGFEPDLSHAAVFRPAPIEIAPDISLARFG